MSTHIKQIIQISLALLSLIFIIPITNGQITTVNLPCQEESDATIGLDRKNFVGSQSEGYMLNFDLPDNIYGPCTKISKITITTTIINSTFNIPGTCVFFSHFENIYISASSLGFGQASVNQALLASEEDDGDINFFDRTQTIDCTQFAIPFGGQIGYDLVPAISDQSCSSGFSMVTDGEITYEYEVCIDVEIDVSDIADINLTAPTNPVCLGNDIELLEDDPDNVDWEWAGPNGFSLSGTDNNPMVPTSASTDFGIFMVTVTDGNGCTATDEIVVMESPTPTADAGPDDNVCLGEPITLTASGGILYEWDTGDNSPSTTVSPTSNMTYTVTVTDGAGCSDTDEVNVTVNENTTAEAGPDDEICEGDNASLTATGGAGGGYEWSTGDNTATISISPITTTTFIVTVTDANGCTATDEADVIVNVNDTADAGSDEEICIGESITLMANGGISYLWDTGDLGPDLIVNPVITTTYIVTVTDNNGCSATDDVTVTVNINTSADAGADQDICENESATLSASGGLDYAWDNGENDQTISVTPTATTVYVVTVTDSNNCTDIDDVEVSVETSPNVNIMSNILEICPGDNLVLEETLLEGDDYVWTLPDGTMSTGATLTIPSTTTGNLGDYDLVVSTSNGCSTTATLEIEEGNCDCEITNGNLAGLICDNNSTPADSADDFLVFTLDPTVVFGGTTFTIAVSAGNIMPSTGTYGSPTSFELQPGSAGGGNINLTLTDDNDNNCNLIVNLQDPGSCSNACILNSASLSTVSCTDNGTPSDDTDDIITFNLDPQVMNGGTSYSVTSASGLVITPTIGNYGLPTTFSLPSGTAGSGNVTLTLTDNNDPNCTLDVTITDPGSCSGTCNITSPMLDNVSCNDGGTGSDDTDDFITFTLNPMSTNSGVSYTVTAGTVTVTPNMGMYGMTTSFQLTAGTAGGGNITITLTDDLDPNCTIDAVITDTGSCSGTCNLTSPVLENVSCNDGGTTSDNADDFISFSLNPTVVNSGATYTVNAGAIVVTPAIGTYGTTTAFQLPAGSANGGNVSLTLIDSDDPTCTIDVLITDPGSCSGACTITDATVTNVFCDDNGTLLNDSDDVINFEINPIGNNLGTSYTISSSAGVVTPALGTYGSASNFLLEAGSAGGGDVTVTLTDSDDPTCTIDIIVSDPGTCSDCSNPPVVSLVLPQTGVCVGDLPVQLGGNTPPGGIFSGIGVVGDTFDPTGLAPGLYPITYTVSQNGCTGQDEDAITVFAQPSVTIDPPMLTVCTANITLDGGMPLGGSYSGDGVTGTTFDATVAGVGTHIITYSFTAFASGCTGTATQIIEVVNQQLCDDGDCTNGIESWDETTCSCITTPPVLGCTNPTAINFDPNATCDDGLCDFGGCPDPGNCDDGDCSNGEEIWNGTLCMCESINPPDPTSCVDDGDCSNGTEVWNATNCMCESVNPPDPTTCTDDGDCSNGTEQWNTTTCMCESINPPDPTACVDDGDCSNGTEVWNATNCMCESINPPDPTTCADDGDCSNGTEQWNTTTCLCESINPPDPTTCVDDGDCTNGTETWDEDTCTCGSMLEVVGCTNPGALNFDPNATCDDGSCTFDCQVLMLNIGDACDDQNPDTANDSVDANCNCNGVDNCDIQTLIQETCEDGSPCTINDVQNFLSDGSPCGPCLGTPVDCSMVDEVLTQPCDDEDPFTLNDVETILVCDESICIPCAGVEPETNIYLPNAIQFDGQNELFGPYSGIAVLIDVFTIYDRWGEAIHHVENISSDDPSVFWDGRFNGRQVEQGVYVYRLVYMQGTQEISEVGDITVIR